MSTPGRVVILNGAPRSGKSSIAAAMQADLPGRWINLGVDAQNRMLPSALLPGIGLRPGGERPDLEPAVVALYGALYDSVAAHARAGFDVVVDVGHHDSYSRPLHLLKDAARRLAGLYVLFVGVHCSIATIMARRDAGGSEGIYLRSGTDGEIPPPVLRWQRAVHDPGLYDLTIDGGSMTPKQSVDAIGMALQNRPDPTVFARLATL